MAVLANVVPQRGREAYTEVCGIFSPCIYDPPLQPKGKKLSKNDQYHCPRCNTTFTRSHTVKQHFPRCIETNGNPDSLRWFDHESNNLTGTPRKINLRATLSKTTRTESLIASPLTDKSEVIMAMSKVKKWSAMAAERQAATVAPTLNKFNGAGPFATHSPTGVMASKVGTSSHSEKPAMASTKTLRQAKSLATPIARDESITSARKQRQSRSQKPKTPRQPKRDWYTAHLFNNAGVLIPSIPGIDSVTERLFDQGEIMSLGPSRSHDNYYPDGGPVGGSFLMDDSRPKKCKRDDEI